MEEIATAEPPIFLSPEARRAFQNGDYHPELQKISATPPVDERRIKSLGRRIIDRIIHPIKGVSAKKEQ